MLDSFDFEKELQIDRDMLEGGGPDKKKNPYKSTDKKNAPKQRVESFDHDQPSNLKFLKIVEKPQGRKPAGTEHLSGDVLALGS